MCLISAGAFCQTNTDPPNSYATEFSKIPTNVYVTDKDNVFGGSQGVVVLNWNVDEALRSPGCRPAEDDQQGNWGSPVFGWQLSLRFAKTNYTAGEPVEGTVLLRNVSTNVLRYALAFAGGFPITWRRVNDGQSGSQPFQEWGGVLSGLGPRLYPRTQREFGVRVDQIIGTNAPGTFLVSVRTRVPKTEQPGMAELSSGNATIRIVQRESGQAPQK
jgi:hypothetical protein